MEKREIEFKGFRINGFVALFAMLAILGVSIYDFATLVGDEAPVLGIIGIIVISIACAAVSYTHLTLPTMAVV